MRDLYNDNIYKDKKFFLETIQVLQDILNDCLKCSAYQNDIHNEELTQIRDLIKKIKERENN